MECTCLDRTPSVGQLRGCQLYRSSVDGYGAKCACAGRHRPSHRSAAPISSNHDDPSDGDWPDQPAAAWIFTVVGMVAESGLHQSTDSARQYPNEYPWWLL